MTNRTKHAALSVIFGLAVLAGCGDDSRPQAEENTGRAESGQADATQDQIIDNRDPAPTAATDRDPTPQTGTGGQIPSAAPSR